ELLVRGFAVCGAAFVGYLLGWWLAVLLNSAIFHAPKTGRAWKAFKNLMRWSLGLAAGILAALILFGSGHGLGFGGGPGTDKGDGPGHAAPEQPAETEPLPPRVKDLPPPTADTVRVTLLAAPVTDGRFYRVEPERTPRTLAEVQGLILERKR